MSVKSKVYFKEVKKNEKPETVAAVNLEVMLQTGVFDSIKKNDMVAIKMHFGDIKNEGHIKPESVKALAKEIRKRHGKPFLVETSTLYVGARSNAHDHTMIAFKHGFTFENTSVPILMADGLLGHSQVSVKINGRHYKEVYVAADVPHYDHLFVMSHVTGHIITGMGATLKNIGMGLVGRGGKLAQHSNVLPSIVEKKCIKCGRCAMYCPAVAISRQGEAYSIDSKKCIGCGECLAICRNEAVKFSWRESSQMVQEKMAEHALGVLNNKAGRVIFSNHLIQVTRECDCLAGNDPAVFDDIGIVASTDPVATDMATIDLARQKHKYEFHYDDKKPLDPLCQLKHAVSIGLGSMDYELVKL